MTTITDRGLPAHWPGGETMSGPDVTVREVLRGGVLATLPSATFHEVGAAVTAAAGCEMPSAGERAEILDETVRRIRAAREDFARVIALEAGKPIATARGEVDRCLDTLTHSAIQARTLTGEMVPMGVTAAGRGAIGMVLREPIGVVGAISPFNFPLNLVAHKLGPAIAAGCPVVLKPAHQTPLSALGLADALRAAGLPEDALHVVIGSADTGTALVEHPAVKLVSFTGSNPVGRGIQTRVPHKRVLLEMGNATPVIVAADADLADAARRVARSGYTHAGQSCVSVQRVYVERAVHGRFMELLTAEVAQLVSGDPLDERTDVGPQIDVDATERTLEWIEEAITGGARAAIRGRVVDGVLTPTLLDDLPEGCRISTQEVFGPVVAVAAVPDLDDAVRRANATPLGLQAGIFTARVGDAIAMSRRLHFGGVLINETPTFRTDQMPYGGEGESGNTREGPAYAVHEMTVPKLVVIRLPEGSRGS
ncbi:MAG: aldehyde dehydrogenase family protein [Thermoleophilia bacterium]